MRLRLLLVAWLGTGLASEADSPLCELMLGRGIYRRTHLSCSGGESACSVDDWWSNPSSQRLVVLSYGHNGFGNQLFQHSVGYLTARALGAAFYVDTIDLKYAPGTELPPNTVMGAAIMDRLLGDEFKLYLLNASHPHRRLCDGEEMFFGERPRDNKLWNGNEAYRAKQAVYFHHLMSGSEPRCLKLIGYFQELPICFTAVKVTVSRSLNLQPCD